MTIPTTILTKTSISTDLNGGNWRQEAILPTAAAPISSGCSHMRIDNSTPVASKTLASVPRAPEHHWPQSAPGGAIAWVLDCGVCDDFGWFQTLADALSRVSIPL